MDYDFAKTKGACSNLGTPCQGFLTALNINQHVTHEHDGPGEL